MNNDNNNNTWICSGEKTDPYNCICPRTNAISTQTANSNGPQIAFMTDVVIKLSDTNSNWTTYKGQPVPKITTDYAKFEPDAATP